MKIKISIPEHYPTADLTQFAGVDNPDEFVFNSATDYADAWFVIEGTLPGDNICLVPDNRVFFLTAEVARPTDFFVRNANWSSYLKQFAGIYTPHELSWDNATQTVPFLPWMINANHGPDMFARSDRDVEYLRALTSLDKTKEISVFCSTQNLTADHMSRFQFVAALKHHFGNRLDWYGNGINPVQQKWDGLADYKYTIVLENQSTPYVITEKLQDAFLALAFPIYWGAPEASEIFGQDTFASINIKDLSSCIDSIEQLLETDPYESKLPALLKAKTVVTDDLNFILRMQQITRNQQAQPSLPTLKTIKPVSDFV
jgi:hypothetical protein